MSYELCPGNGLTKLGRSDTQWTEVHAASFQKGGVELALSTDSRFPSADEKAALTGTSGTPSAANPFMTKSDRSRVLHLDGVIGLTGGGASKLDGYTTVGLTAGLVVSLTDDNAGAPTFRVYELVTASDAESSPTVIRPDDYGTSGFIWKLRSSGASHASGHIMGGSDEIDADKLALDFTATNYTPANDGSITDDDAQLSAHLAGINEKLGDVLSSRTGVYRQITFGGEFFQSNTGSPTVGAVVFGSVKRVVATLPDSASKSVMVCIPLPQAWDGTNFKLKLEWSGGGTGDVRWEVKGAFFDTGDDLTAALGSAHAFADTESASGYLKLTSAFAPTLAGTGNLMVLDIQRTGGDASDTLSANAYLHAVHVQYKESATEPAAW